MEVSDKRVGAGTGQGARLSGRLAAIALILVVAFLPLSRAVVQVLTPEGNATAIARLQIAVMELAVIAAVLANARVRVPPLKALPTPAFWVLLIWFVWGGTAVIMADIPTIALMRQTEWVVHGLFAWCLWAFLAAHPDWRAVLPRYFVWGFLLYGIIIAFFLLNVSEPESFPWTGGLIGFRNVRHFSAYAALALIAAHWPLLTNRDDAAPDRRIFILLTVLWAFLLWSGSRGAVLAVFGALGILTVLRLVPAPARLWRVTVLAGLLGLFVSLPFTPPHPSFGILQRAADIQEAESADDLASNRLAIWANVAEKIAAAPAYGMGPDHYAMTSDKPARWDFEHPHNSLLQAALEWGIPGALAFAAGIGGLLVFGVKTARRYPAPERAVGLALALTVLLHSLVSGTLYYGVPIMVLGLAAALMLAPDGAAAAPSVPTKKGGRFDTDIHGLTALAGLLMVIYAASITAVLLPGPPAPDGWRSRLVSGFPAAMTMEAAGERLDRWAVHWREEGRDGAYEWLEWTAEHSRTPWTSLDILGTWMVADGYDGEGHRLQRDAAALRPERWTPQLDDTLYPARSRR